jgi:hypothetical protein
LEGGRRKAGEIIGMEEGRKVLKGIKDEEVFHLQFPGHMCVIFILPLELFTLSKKERKEGRKAGRQEGRW